MYIIQNRFTKAQRGLIDTDSKKGFNVWEKLEKDLSGMIKDEDNAFEWVNTDPIQYHTLDAAQLKCEDLIKSGQHKAENIRILEVVCTFESEIIVKSKTNGQESDI